MWEHIIRGLTHIVPENRMSYEEADNCILIISNMHEEYTSQLFKNNSS